MRTLGRSWDAQELLQEGGIKVSCDTLREWNIKCSPLIAEELRHRKSHWDSWWHMDEVWILSAVSVTGCSWAERMRMSTPVRWRVMDEQGIVLDVLRQRHRDTEAAIRFLVRPLGEPYVPETICTDKVASYWSAIRELRALQEVGHQEVISTTRCNNLVEERASVASGAALPKTSTSSVIPERRFSLKSEVTNIGHFRFGVRLAQGWPELQATPPLRLPTE
ncbi:DDE-type integrase/transposase/recombinase [Deinococcus sp. UYEF24]